MDVTAFMLLVRVRWRMNAVNKVAFEYTVGSPLFLDLQHTTVFSFLSHSHVVNHRLSTNSSCLQKRCKSRYAMVREGVMMQGLV